MKQKSYFNPFPPSAHRDDSVPSVVKSPSSDPHSAFCNLHSLISFRPYQREAFEDRTRGIDIWLWGRQTGKSFTLAAWAVDRLITNPGRTVTILSNSIMNGIELNLKCAEVCRKLGQAFEQVDLSIDHRFENMKRETRITLFSVPSVSSCKPSLPITGRILVLPANPRTARGFSGDLILDEFAFHEDSAAIWNEASPILEANPDYLCRIASTPNGKHNQFYRMVTNPLYPVRKVTRTDAYAQGCPVYHPVTRKPITPAEARALAPNKRAYDQNFECVFEDENMALLTHELISAAERENIGFIANQSWPSNFGGTPLFASANVSVGELNSGGLGEPTSTSPHLISASSSPSAQISPPFPPLPPVKPSSSSSFPCLPCVEKSESSSAFSVQPSSLFFAGVDVGRHRDRTVITLLEKSASTYLVRAILRIEQMRFPDQQRQLETLLHAIPIKRVCIDMTGLGAGLVEYTQEKFGDKIVGIDFSTSVRFPSYLTQSSVLSPQSSQLFFGSNTRIPRHPTSPNL